MPPEENGSEQGNAGVSHEGSGEGVTSNEGSGQEAPATDGGGLDSEIMSAFESFGFKGRQSEAGPEGQTGSDAEAGAEQGAEAGQEEGGDAADDSDAAAADSDRSEEGQEADTSTEDEGEDGEYEEPDQGQPDQSQLQEQMRQQYEAYQQQLEQHYQLDDETLQRLEDEPQTEWPKMLRRVHESAVMEVWQGLQQQLPQYMQQFAQQYQTQNTAASKFFERWPGLKSPKYKDAIKNAAQAVQQTNPDLPFDKRIEVIGKTAAVALGEDPTKFEGQGQKGNGQQKQQQPRQRPRKPINAGQGGGTPPTDPHAGRESSTDNEFAAIAEEFLGAGFGN